MREREVVREPIREREREREIIVDRRAPVERDVVYRDRPRRGGGGGVVAAIVGVLLLLLIGWFALRALDVVGDAAESDVELNVPEDLPDEVNVDVEG